MFCCKYLIALTSVTLFLSSNLWAEKEQLRGLMLRATPEMRVVPMRGKRSAFVPPVEGVDATLVFAEWADLQPEKFGAITQNNIVDKALTAVTLWNLEHPSSQVKLRLRTLAGIYSPDWVMLHAGAVQIDYRKKKESRAVVRVTPQFWTPAYADAWSDFQTKMAAKYDRNPLIADVSISGGMTLHTEVMWRQPGFSHVLPALMKAGLTRESDLTCLKNDITRFMEIWKKTPVEMTFNTRRHYKLTSDGSLKPTGPDVEFANALIRHIAAESKRLDHRYMIGNHSLSKYSVIEHQKYNQKNHILHALMKEHADHGTALYFQTEVFTADVVTQLVREGIKMGATLIELPNDITPSQIKSPELQALRNTLRSSHARPATPR